MGSNHPYRRGQVTGFYILEKGDMNYYDSL